MKKKKTILLACALAAVIAAPRVFAAVPVFDAANTAENHATFLQSAQQVLNSYAQIANQTLELTSLSNESLDAHATAINGEMNLVQTIMGQLQGLMNPAKPAGQVWMETFKPIDNYFNLANILTPTAMMTNSQNMSNTVDKTLQDGLRTAKAHADITQDAALLQELMEKNKTAVGNKQLGQVQNDLIAQQNSIYIKQNQIMAAMTTSMIASNAKQNQIDAQATALNKQYSDALKETINSSKTPISEGKRAFR